MNIERHQQKASFLRCSTAASDIFKLSSDCVVFFAFAFYAKVGHDWFETAIAEVKIVVLAIASVVTRSVSVNTWRTMHCKRRLSD